MSEETATPRVDRMLTPDHWNTYQVNEREGTEYVPASFARQLEREKNELHEAFLLLQRNEGRLVEDKHRLERELNEAKAVHQKYACAGESLLQTLHRLMSAANNYEGNAKGLVKQRNELSDQLAAAQKEIEELKRIAQECLDANYANFRQRSAPGTDS